LIVEGPMDEAGGGRLLNVVVWDDDLSESFPCFDIVGSVRECQECSHRKGLQLGSGKGL